MRTLLIAVAAISGLSALISSGAVAATAAAGIGVVPTHSLATPVDYFWHRHHWHHRHWTHGHWRYWD